MTSDDTVISSCLFSPDIFAAGEMDIGEVMYCKVYLLFNTCFVSFSFVASLLFIAYDLSSDFYRSDSLRLFLKAEFFVNVQGISQDRACTNVIAARRGQMCILSANITGMPLLYKNVNVRINPSRLCEI